MFAKKQVDDPANEKSLNIVLLNLRILV